MQITIPSRLRNAWNVFRNKDVYTDSYSYPVGNFYRPDRSRCSPKNYKTIVTSIYNRIAMDCAAIDLRHVRLDQNGRFLETIEDGLNNCLSLEANIDQTSRAFVQDIVMSMFDEGVVAIVPTDIDDEPTAMPTEVGSYDILTLRVGKITQWYPLSVEVELYDVQTGKHRKIVLPKSMVCIVENPLYSVINEPNSIMKRLVHKLNLLDVIDEQSSSGKLDLIIQLPYVIKSEARRDQAEKRKQALEEQLMGSKYGIAYTDGTEKITQLNRPVENNLMKQIEYLTAMLYSQLGITQTVLDGTADEQTMLNYYNRTIEPILEAIVSEMKRKFLTKTARSQRHTIMFIRNPFKLVPIESLAEVADTFTRNEILTGNEMRQIIGMRPSDDPSADELRNKNLNPAAVDQNDKQTNNERNAEVEEEV